MWFSHHRSAAVFFALALPARSLHVPLLSLEREVPLDLVLLVVLIPHKVMPAVAAMISVYPLSSLLLPVLRSAVLLT